MKMSTLDYISWILIVIGALNWGFIGAFNFNLVTMLFGVGVFTQWVYIIVGLAGLYSLWKILTMKKR